MSDYDCRRKGQRRNIKQIMPIPEGFMVMEPITQEDGREKMEPAWSRSYCLALVEGEYGDYVVPYEMSLCGDIEDNAALVKIRHCPNCGKIMEPHMPMYEDYLVSYTCDCQNKGEEKSL